MMAEEEQEYNENGSPRSRHSRIRSPIQFVNHTGRSVKVIWLNFRGEEDLSITPALASHSNVKVNTFVTHPWIAVDEITNERMLLNFRDVFYPNEPTIRRVTDISSWRRRVLAVRKQVVITAPVHSLEDYCKKEIRRLVPNQIIKKLPLPQGIIVKLLEPSR